MIAALDNHVAGRPGRVNITFGDVVLAGDIVRLVRVERRGAAGHSLAWIVQHRQVLILDADQIAPMYCNGFRLGHDQCHLVGQTTYYLGARLHRPQSA